jgi:hypothetical protein
MNFHFFDKKNYLQDSVKGSNHVHLQIYDSFRIMKKHYLNPKAL